VRVVVFNRAAEECHISCIQAPSNWEGQIDGQLNRDFRVRLNGDAESSELAVLCTNEYMNLYLPEIPPLSK